jgi:hypothetical protein
MGTMQKIGKTATSIRTNGKGVTSVRYHSTDVASFNDRWILLNTGGWWTATTKSRMNQTANQFGLGFAVFQVRGTWTVQTHKPWNGENYVSLDRKEMPSDLMLINRKSGRLYPKPTDKRLAMTGLI